MNPIFAIVMLLAFQTPKKLDPSSCFVISEMTPTENGRYLTDSVSHCARDFDAVYVVVKFSAGKRSLGRGLWALYWVQPGKRERHEFGAPASASGFDRVELVKITDKLEDAK